MYSAVPITRVELPHVGFTNLVTGVTTYCDPADQSRAAIKALEATVTQEVIALMYEQDLIDGVHVPRTRSLQDRRALYLASL